MASRMESDPRHWATYWSTIKGKNDRYRHEIMLDRKHKQWLVRTQVWIGFQPIYYTNVTKVPADVGEYCFYHLRMQWTNIDEEGRPLHPPEFPGGFPEMAAATLFRFNRKELTYHVATAEDSELAHKDGQCDASVQEAGGGAGR